MNSTLVPGLYLHPDAITQDVECDIISWLNQQPWSNTLKRRTQHYGYTYDYQHRKIDSTVPITGPLLHVAEWLQSVGIMTPEQCIVNEYTKDQGISAHTDLNLFGPRIVSLSLGAPTDFIFRNRTTKQSIEIEVNQRSLMIMDHEARYDWTHEIPRRNTVTINGHQVTKPDDYRRISLTYRTIAR